MRAVLTLCLIGCVACSDLLGVDDFTDQRSELPDDLDQLGGGDGVGGAGGSGGSLPGTQQWARAFGAANPDIGQRIAVAADDSVVITGTIGDAVDFGGGMVGNGAAQLFVTRLSPTGDYSMGTASSGDAAIALGDSHLDGDGNTLVAGSITAGSFSAVEGGAQLDAAVGNGREAFVAKMNPEGTEVFSAVFASPDEQHLSAVASDPRDRSVVVAGFFRGSVTLGNDTITSQGSDDILLARLNAGGEVLWARGFGDGSSQVASAMTVDESGAIWVAGTFDGTIDFEQTHTSIGRSDIWLAKLSSDGDVEASARFGTGGAHTIGEVIPHAGGVLVVGSFTGTTTFGGDPLSSTSDGGPSVEDIFVVSLDENLGHRWSRRFGGTGADVGYSVAIDSAQNVIVGGSYSADLPLGDNTSAGGMDALVLKLDMTGEVLWHAAFGRNADDHVGGIAIDSADAVLITGQFVDGFTLGQDVVFGQGEEDIFVAKLLP